MNPIQTQANYLFTINFNILHLHPDLVVGLFPSVSSTKIFQALKFFGDTFVGCDAILAENLLTHLPWAPLQISGWQVILSKSH